MSKIIAMECAERDMSVNPRKLRASGRIPATVYSKNEASLSIDVDGREFKRVYHRDTPSIFTLKVAQEECRAVVKNVQQDPVSFEVQNIEFLKLTEGQELTLSVPVVLVNEAPATKKGGLLLQYLNEIDISCLPKNIPDSVKFDLSVIEDVDTSITVDQLTFPEGVSSATSGDALVLKVSAPSASAAEETEGAEATASAAE